MEQLEVVDSLRLSIDKQQALALLIKPDIQCKIRIHSDCRQFIIDLEWGDCRELDYLPYREEFLFKIALAKEKRGNFQKIHRRRRSSKSRKLILEWILGTCLCKLEVVQTVQEEIQKEWQVYSTLKCFEKASNFD